MASEDCWAVYFVSAPSSLAFAVRAASSWAVEPDRASTLLMPSWKPAAMVTHSA